MIGSREAVVDYMTPLGLAPPHGDAVTTTAPALGSRPAAPRLERRPTTTAPTPTASASTARRPAATPSPSTARRSATRFAEPRRLPDEYLLWFHHVPWDHRDASGRTLWDELCYRYNFGVQRSAQCKRLELAGAVRRRGALRRTSRRCCGFKSRKRAGGATPVCSTSRRSPSCRSRRSTSSLPKRSTIT